MSKIGYAVTTPAAEPSATVRPDPRRSLKNPPTGVVITPTSEPNVTAVSAALRVNPTASEAMSEMANTASA